MSVVVIGAGFAGLSAARTLQAGRSLQVTVLEGSSRVGGRAHTLQTESAGQIELGATWLHGIKGHPAYDLAIERGLISPADKQRAKNQWGVATFVREGLAEPVDGDDAKTASLAGKLYSDAVEQAQEAEHSAGGATVGQYLRKKWRELRKERGTDPLYAEAWRWRENLQRAIDGCRTTDEMSSAGLAAYSELKGPNMPLSCGYSRVAEVMAEGLDIRYQHTVERIDWGESGATVHCSSGESFKCDAVICTVSLGVLKEGHKRLFHPPLQAQKQEAIRELAIGVVDKLFIRFHSAKQPAAGSSGASEPAAGRGVLSHQLLWKVCSTVGNAGFNPTTQPASDSPDAGNSAAARSVLSHQLLWKVDADDGYWDATSDPHQGDDTAVTSSGRPWWQGSYSLRMWGPEFLPVQSGARPIQGGQGPVGALVTDGTALAEGRGGAQQTISTVLESPGNGSMESVAEDCDVWGVMWVSGRAAAEMEACTDAEVHEGIRHILDAFPAIKLPKEFSVLRTRWGSDPLHRGSYSYVSASASTSDVEALSQPLEVKDPNGLMRPVVLFAGEATHVDHIGTVHGACFSGDREAQRLLKYFAQSKKFAIPA
ncbi:g10303 [Coccomyxa viridis]|uniref:G10303 protein n=1 Tax=Coccomyxa viridis TaxID=1274662 RepID=A0ABP1G7R6_9CHLO